jgi:hypothetical protein
MPKDYFAYNSEEEKEVLSETDKGGVRPQSTYICRVQNSVWRLQKYWPPTPRPPSECVLPPHQRQGGTHSPGGEGGGGVNILEDAGH